MHPATPDVFCIIPVAVTRRVHVPHDAVHASMEGQKPRREENTGALRWSLSTHTRSLAGPHLPKHHPKAGLHSYAREPFTTKSNRLRSLGVRLEFN